MIPFRTDSLLIQRVLPYKPFHETSRKKPKTFGTWKKWYFIPFIQRCLDYFCPFSKHSLTNQDTSPLLKCNAVAMQDTYNTANSCLPM